MRDGRSKQYTAPYALLHVTFFSCVDVMATRASVLQPFELCLANTVSASSAYHVHHFADTATATRTATRTTTTSTSTPTVFTQHSAQPPRGRLMRPASPAADVTPAETESNRQIRKSGSDAGHSSDRQSG